MYTPFDDFRQATSEKLCATLDAIAFDGCEAYRLTDRLFIGIAAALRKRFGLSSYDTQLMFASIRHEHEDRLYNLIRGTLDLETAKNLFRIHSGED